jgi:hypothetical protein
MHACIHHESALDARRTGYLIVDRTLLFFQTASLRIYIIIWMPPTWMDHWELRTGMMLHHLTTI